MRFFIKGALWCGLLLSLFFAQKSIAQTTQYTTPNQFFNNGTPTFVIGTKGDQKTKDKIRNEVRFIRDFIFPNARIIEDTAIDISKGPQAWPSNPIVYGGPHVNSLMEQLQNALPFTMKQNFLAFGKKQFKGDEYGIISVIPARQRDKKQPGYPEFMIYAGTGTPGVGGINSVWHGNEPLLITDRFGRMLSATWKRDAQGQVMPYIPKQDIRRTEWRMAKNKNAANVNLFFPKRLPPKNNESDVVGAIKNGLRLAVERLELRNSPSINVFVYPDRKSKEYITGNNGDGHVSIIGNSLHVLPFDTSKGGPLESLIAHEATHIYAYHEWGPAGSSFLGEGIAVWTSQGYGGKTLQAHIQELKGTKVPEARKLLGKNFSGYPENKGYPLAGIFVSAAIDTAGLVPFMNHLYGASERNWEQQAHKAGTTPEALQKAFAAQFAK